MSDEPKTEKPVKDSDKAIPPDKRGPRPTDPNQLAKSIVDQATKQGDEKQQNNSD